MTAPTDGVTAVMLTTDEYAAVIAALNYALPAIHANCARARSLEEHRTADALAAIARHVDDVIELAGRSVVMALYAYADPHPPVAGDQG